jgi:hypothetical protein
MTERKDKLAAAFSDLESPICDLKHMARILQALMEDNLQPSSAEIKGNYRVYTLLAEDVEMLDFAMLEVETRSRKLFDLYYESCLSTAVPPDA